MHTKYLAMIIIIPLFHYSTPDTVQTSSLSIPGSHCIHPVPTADWFPLLSLLWPSLAPHNSTWRRSNSKHFRHHPSISFLRWFLAPSGAQGVTISACLYVPLVIVWSEHSILFFLAQIFKLISQRSLISSLTEPKILPPCSPSDRITSGRNLRI